MKYLILPILALLLYAFGNRNENNTKTDPRYEWLKTLPNITSDYYSQCEGLNLDQTFYSFIYRDSVNGFKISGFLINASIINDGIEGNAVLEFERRNYRFTVLHPYFTIDKEQRDRINGDYGEEDGDTFFTRSGSLGFYLDYKIAESDTTIHKWSVPFFFHDINSDGEQDLIFRYPRQGYKDGEKYKVHYSKWNHYDEQSDIIYDRYTPM